MCRGGLPLCCCRRRRRFLFSLQRTELVSESNRTVGVRHVKFGSIDVRCFRKNQLAAERFVPPRRRRRGLRRGKARSRGGKPPLIAAPTATLVKKPDVHLARKDKRIIRESLFMDNTSAKLHRFVARYRESTGLRRVEGKRRCFLLYSAFCRFVRKFHHLPPTVPFSDWVHSGWYYAKRIQHGAGIAQSKGTTIVKSSDLDDVLDALGLARDDPGPMSSVGPPPNLTVNKRGRVFRGPGGIMMRDFGSYVSPLSVGEVGRRGGTRPRGGGKR